MLSHEDRAAVGSGLQHSMHQMGRIVGVVTGVQHGGPGGGGGQAFYVPAPGANPVYTRLFVDLQKILYEIEAEILKGWHIQPPVPPSAQG